MHLPAAAKKNQTKTNISEQEKNVSLNRAEPKEWKKSVKANIIKVYESWYIAYLATSGNKRETTK